jgi:hypothetical protein
LTTVTRTAGQQPAGSCLNLPGEIGVTVTAPEGVEYCTWYRDETRVDSFRPTIEADALNSLYVICY